jgi:hypothetical protein
LVSSCCHQFPCIQSSFTLNIFLKLRKLNLFVHLQMARIKMAARLATPTSSSVVDKVETRTTKTTLEVSTVTAATTRVEAHAEEEKAKDVPAGLDKDESDEGSEEEAVFEEDGNDIRLYMSQRAMYISGSLWHDMFLVRHEHDMTRWCAGLGQHDSLFVSCLGHWCGTTCWLKHNPFFYFTVHTYVY